jgi:transcriptional regulator NrdR family protein
MRNEHYFACPTCGAATKVIDSRPTKKMIRRRRVCLGRGEHRFTCYEMTGDFFNQLSEDADIARKLFGVILRAAQRSQEIPP